MPVLVEAQRKGCLALGSRRRARTRRAVAHRHWSMLRRSDSNRRFDDRSFDDWSFDDLGDDRLCLSLIELGGLVDFFLFDFLFEVDIVHALGELGLLVMHGR